MRTLLAAMMLLASPALGQQIHAPAIIAEGASGFLSLAFEDHLDRPLQPSRVCVWVDDEQTQLRLEELVCQSPSGTAREAVFELRPASQRIIDDSLTVEPHLISVIFEYGHTQYPGELLHSTRKVRYLVVNDPGIVVKLDPVSGEYFAYSIPQPTPVPIAASTPSPTPP